MKTVRAKVGRCNVYRVDSKLPHDVTSQIKDTKVDFTKIIRLLRYN